MVREIKFRAWLQGKHDSINFGFDGFMDHDVTIQNGQWCSVESGWDIQGQYKSIPLMQFTGLTDKNGKEIYEGDIVRCKDYGEEPIGVIVYRGDGFVIDWKSETDFNNSISVRLDTTEVIGNIYENPELLGGK